MWILWTILGFVAALITAILLLPVHVIVKNDEKEPLILRYKYLNKTFGENPNPNDPIVKTIKKSAGIQRFEKERLETNIAQSGLMNTVSESYDIIKDLLRQLVRILQYCTVTKCNVRIVCASEDASEVAIRYGQASAATYSLLNLLNAIVKIRKRGCHIDIRGDFNGGPELFRYEVVVSVRFCRVLGAFFRIAYAEAQRVAQEKESKNQSR